MIPPQDDEETPLLQRPEQPTAKTPLPWDQFWILLLLEMPGFLSVRTLASFIPQLIRDIGVTHGDESQVSYYIGILVSMSSSLLPLYSWLIFSRATIILCSAYPDCFSLESTVRPHRAETCIADSSISSCYFDVFVWAVEDLSWSSAFDPSDAVIKTLLMDITDATNMPKAYGYMPIPVMIATTVGSVIGGLLSRPADRFPDIFGRSELLRTYPYLLPCSISAFLISMIWLVVYICLKESDVTDWGKGGMMTGKIYIRRPWLVFQPLNSASRVRIAHVHVMCANIVKGGFFEQSYLKSRQSSSNVIVDPANPGEVQSKPLPLRALLTSKVLSVMASYTTMGLFHMAFSSILPIFYATPIELDGLSLDPPRIGALLAASGIIQGIFQLLSYARLHRHFGARTIYITGVGTGIPIVILFPVTNALARAYGIGMAMWLCAAIQLTLKTSLIMCFPAPNHASLGATAGIAEVALAVGRIVGPASAASVFSYSLRQGHDLWLIYYFLIAIAFLAVGTGLLLPRDPSVWEDSQ
ncbi:hypothetical protein BDR06DRAFT_1014610 [Suillus hirtellus]|nr:hypothetical protein BDR06DRAFT_1014610 [Suillus hirtellus]